MAQWKVCTQAVSCLGIVVLAGCTARPVQSPDERLQHQAARSAEQLHHGVQQAGKEAHIALRKVGRDTRDIVIGAREGWRQGAVKDGSLLGSSPRKVNINSASTTELEKLFGVHAGTARQIVKGRPWSSPDELRKHGIVTPAEYDRIAARLTAK